MEASIKLEVQKKLILEQHMEHIHYVLQIHQLQANVQQLVFHKLLADLC